MTNLGPLRFRPIFRRFLWGGRRLGSLLNKPIGEGADYAESWEIVDHGADQSRVAYGPWHDVPLAELLSTHREELLGRNADLEHFPLLFKFLDAHQRLSVQVHPNDDQAAQLQPPDSGKTEAWIVLHAEPDAVVYAGLRTGIDERRLRQSLRSGTVEDCLSSFRPRVGDCILIPAGTVHALGAGLLVAEIQQSSNTTFRLFDWGRLGADGKPRALHVDEAISVVDFHRGPIRPSRPRTSPDVGAVELVSCGYFIVNRCALNGTAEFGGDERFHLLTVLHGTLQVDHDPASRPVGMGETILLPAAGGPWRSAAASDTLVLDICLP